MTFIFKFYLKKNKNSNHPKICKLIALDDQNMENYIGRKEICILKTEKTEYFDFFEVIFDAITKTISEIRGIESDCIRPELIKHANEVNSCVTQELKEYNKDKEELPGLKIDQVQDILDRVYLYGEEFLIDLDDLLNKYPTKIEWVKVDEQDQALSQRKVSKLIL